MNLIKKVNYILAIIGIVIEFVHFFIRNIQIPLWITLPFLLVMFLLMGIEQVKGKQDKSGYFYFVAAIIISLAVIKDLFIYLL